MKRLIRQAQRWLYWTHRWAGIVTCLLFAMWFVSGLVMIYVGFPALTDAERRALLPVIDGQQVRLSPTDALAAAGQGEWPRSLKLEMLHTEPVYRITGWDTARLTISARDGHRIDSVDAATALAVAGGSSAALEERDQWSVTARYDPLRPFHLVSRNDAAGTQLYISSRTGEIALDTTRSERFWNWLGSVPHWIYPTLLRRDAALWTDVVLWVSGFCILVAVSGIWIGIQRLRVGRRYSSGAMSPYRGWMWWHHWFGVIGSLFLLSWIVSGWLSMNPNGWFSGRNTDPAALQRYAGHSAPDFPLSVAPAADAVEMRFLWIGGQPLVVQYRRDNNTVGAGLSAAQVFAAAAQLLPQSKPVQQMLLTEEDDYWYSHHMRRLMPVLRVGFDDASGSVFYIDPLSGDVLMRVDNSQRRYRWLFSALHSLDFQVLRHATPAWKATIWILSLLGLGISVSGIVIGWRYLRRRMDRNAARI